MGARQVTSGWLGLLSSKALAAAGDWYLQAPAEYVKCSSCSRQHAKFSSTCLWNSPDSGKQGRFWHYCAGCLPHWESYVLNVKEKPLDWRCTHVFAATDKRRARRCGKPALVVHCREEGAGSVFEGRCQAHEKHWQENSRAPMYANVTPEDTLDWMRANRVCKALLRRVDEK